MARRHICSQRHTLIVDVLRVPYPNLTIRAGWHLKTKKHQTNCGISCIIVYFNEIFLHSELIHRFSAAITSVRLILLLAGRLKLSIKCFQLTCQTLSSAEKRENVWFFSWVLDLWVSSEPDWFPNTIL